MIDLVGNQEHDNGYRNDNCIVESDLSGQEERGRGKAKGRPGAMRGRPDRCRIRDVICAGPPRIAWQLARIRF